MEPVKVPAPDMAGLQAKLEERFADMTLRSSRDELNLLCMPADLPKLMRALRDEPDFAFDQLIDVCGVDYSGYGMGYEGLFSKDAMSSDRFTAAGGGWMRSRFAVVYHLLSLTLNHRLRVKVMLDGDALQSCPTVVDIWPAATWYEREAFDLFGIVFDGHPDLRRILTDYGFIGHPFRKDFPVYGNVEMRYDPEKGRVVYQPVSISPREVVPRVVRRDNFGNQKKNG